VASAPKLLIIRRGGNGFAHVAIRGQEPIDELNLYEGTARQRKAYGWTRRGRLTKNKVKAIFGEDGNGDPKKTFGRFLLAVMAKDSKTLDEMGSKFCDWDQKTAMATQTGTSGRT
jgi:hypothetical protein